MVMWYPVGFSVGCLHFKSSVSTRLLRRVLSAQATQSLGVMGTLLSCAFDDYCLCIHSLIQLFAEHQ